ncbi:MAG: radical SAM protein [Deltaproteobacteria bacterium]|nr:radical SAM protein [Candidatus Zymogenaceae bacterium]
MKLYDDIRRFFLVNVLHHGLGVLSTFSDKNLIRTTYWMEKITKRDHYKRAIRSIRNLFEQNHPSFSVFKKVLRETNTHHRKRLVKAFFINQLLIGSNRRKAFSESPGGFYPPGLMVISPTMRCNLNCYGCYAGSYDKGNDLPIEVIDRVLNEGKELGMFFAVISGGEPFIRDDVVKLFERHKDVAFQVYTHGGLLDEKMIGRIIKAGNILPAISLEGFEEDTDRRRGKGHYKKIMNAMRLLKENGVLFGFSSTQTRENADIIASDAFVDHMVDMGCTIGWYFTYVPIGREPNLNLMPTPEQRDSLRRWVRHVRNTKPILVADFWNDGPVVGGCIAAGRKYLHINANGDIEPCVFCHFAEHNIKDTPLKVALNSKVFRFIRQTQEKNPNPLRPCMIIDHPEVFREAASMDGVYFTHDGADNVVTDISNFLDHYAADYAHFSEKAWREEYDHE